MAANVTAVALSICASTIIIMLAIQWRSQQVEASVHCDNVAGGSIKPRSDEKDHVDDRLSCKRVERRALAGAGDDNLGSSSNSAAAAGSSGFGNGNGNGNAGSRSLAVGNTGGGNSGTVGGSGSSFPGNSGGRPGNGGIAGGGSGGGLGNAGGGIGDGSSNNSASAGIGNINVGDGTTGGENLAVGYYDLSCPSAEAIVRAAFSGNILSDPTAPAALLRLAFHDCQVGGCDASILLNSGGSDTSELLSQKNFGIRRLDFIDRIKLSLETACPGVVSCADIIVLAAREAIAISGGPRIIVQTGRRDSLFCSNKMADAALPPASVSMDTFLDIFQSKGMTVTESVAILGAHTIGIGHCVNIVDRLYPNTDAIIGTFFSSQLKFQCPTRLPQALNNNTVINNDLTNLIFDNQYYRDIMNGRGLFFIDAMLGLDPRTSPSVAAFAGNQQLFFDVFASAFNKLTSSNVLTGNNGQIRSNCHFTL